MERETMVHTLATHTGVSPEAARDALERSGWVMVDAMLLLEQEQKTGAQTTAFGTDRKSGAQEYETVRPVVSTGKHTGLWERLWTLLRASLTHALVVRRQGSCVVRLPVLLAIAFLCCSFRLSVLALLCGLFAGCQFSVEGRDGAEKPAAQPSSPANASSAAPANGANGTNGTYAANSADSTDDPVLRTFREALQKAEQAAARMQAQNDSSPDNSAPHDDSNAQ